MKTQIEKKKQGNISRLRRNILSIFMCPPIIETTIKMIGQLLIV